MKLAMRLTIKLWKNGVVYLMLLRSEALNYLLQKKLNTLLSSRLFTLDQQCWKMPSIPEENEVKGRSTGRVGRDYF